MLSVPCRSFCIHAQGHTHTHLITTHTLLLTKLTRSHDFDLNTFSLRQQILQTNGETLTQQEGTETIQGSSKLFLFFSFSGAHLLDHTWHSQVRGHCICHLFADIIQAFPCSRYEHYLSAGCLSTSNHVSFTCCSDPSR